jgi:hypothetical protein
VIGEPGGVGIAVTVGCGRAQRRKRGLAQLIATISVLIKKKCEIISSFRYKKYSKYRTGLVGKKCYSVEDA